MCVTTELKKEIETALSNSEWYAPFYGLYFDNKPPHSFVHGGKKYISLPLHSPLTKRSDWREIPELQISQIMEYGKYRWENEDTKPAYIITYRKYSYIRLFMREDVVVSLINGEPFKEAYEKAVKRDQEKKSNWQPPQEELEPEYTQEEVRKEIQEHLEEIMGLLDLLK